VIAALILWMGIGSPFFTRRTEAYTQKRFCNSCSVRKRITPAACSCAVQGGKYADHAPATASGSEHGGVCAAQQTR